MNIVFKILQDRFLISNPPWMGYEIRQVIKKRYVFRGWNNFIKINIMCNRTSGGLPQTCRTSKETSYRVGPLTLTTPSNAIPSVGKIFSESISIKKLYLYRTPALPVLNSINDKEVLFPLPDHPRTKRIFTILSTQVDPIYIRK